MTTFEILRATRKNILSIVEKYDLEELNFIPKNFNNNLIWNFGHVIITQQLLCYKMSGQEIKIDKTLVDKYRKGSSPETFIDQKEVDLIKSYTFETVEQMEKDYEAGLFSSYNSYQTSYGVLLDNIETAMQFNNSHEAMHLGYMLSIRKFMNH